MSEHVPHQNSTRSPLPRLRRFDIRPHLNRTRLQAGQGDLEGDSHEHFRDWEIELQNYFDNFDHYFRTEVDPYFSSLINGVGQNYDSPHILQQNQPYNQNNLNHQPARDHRTNLDQEEANGLGTGYYGRHTSDTLTRTASWVDDQSHVDHIVDNLTPTYNFVMEENNTQDTQNRSSFTGRGHRDTQEEYDRVKLEFDKAQLDLDKLDYRKETNPESWNQALADEYRQIEVRKAELQAKLDELRPHLQQANNTPGILDPSTPFPPVIANDQAGHHRRHENINGHGARVHPQTSANNQSFNHNARQHQHQHQHPRQQHIRTPPPGYSTDPRRPQADFNRRSSSSNPLAVLPPHVVPYIRAYQTIDESTIGSASNDYQHSNSAVNAVSAGGYPIPTIPPEYFGAINRPGHPQNAPAPPLVRRPRPTQRQRRRTSFFRSFSVTTEWKRGVTAFKNHQNEASMRHFLNITIRAETASVVPHAHIHYNIGILHTLRSEHMAASGAFEAAIRHDSSLVIAHYALGVSLYHQREIPRATTAFEAALSLFNGRRAVDYASHGLAVVLEKEAVVECRGLSISAFEEYVEMPWYPVDVLFDLVDEVQRSGVEEGNEEEEEDSEANEPAKIGPKKMSAWAKIKRRFSKTK